MLLDTYVTGSDNKYVIGHSLVAVSLSQFRNRGYNRNQVVLHPPKALDITTRQNHGCEVVNFYEI